MYLNLVRITSAVALAALISVGIPYPPQNFFAGAAVLSASASAERVYVAQAQKVAVEAPIAGNSAESPQLKNEAEASAAAQLQKQIEDELARQQLKQMRVIKVQQLLQKNNSPMVDNAQDFVEAAEQYDLDWRLVVSISGVESTFGKHVAPGTYNPFGWGGGYIRFESWRDAIYTVSKGISEGYVKDGLDTPLKMQPRYAPPSHTWGTKVNYFMNKVHPTKEIEIASL